MVAMVRVLVADDDPTLLRALGRVLRSFEVTVVASGQEAIRILGERPFDVVLMDYGIPPTNGIALLESIASTHPTVRRYLMSGFEADMFDTHVASRLVHRFFQKPIEMAALKQELAAAVPR
jgi:DNA-binding NtrC family response regulator